MLVSKKAQTTCPECGHPLDTIGGPAPGAFVVCRGCFVLFKHDAEKYPRPASGDEIVRHLSLEMFDYLKRCRLEALARQTLDGITEDANRRLRTPRWKSPLK